METYVTEEQQWEGIKNWFKKYGNAISWAVIVVLSIILAINYWNHHRQVVREQASEHYLALLEGFNQNDINTIKSKSDLLKREYSGTPYASLAAFFKAKEAVKANRFDEAEQELRWVVDNAKEIDFKALARTRLMRVLIAENKLDKAISLYHEKQADGYLTLMAELKGDALIKQKDPSAAKSAYEKALSSAPQKGLHGPLLKMKMEDLGVKVGDK